MANLLRAGFSRLKQDKVFWAAALIVVLATGLMTLQSIGSYQGDSARGLPMDNMEEYFFNQAPLVGVLTGIFVSLFWGTEHSDGTIRNKLCVGHRRSHVYLSHFFVCLAANLTFIGLWFLCASPMYVFIGPMAMGLTGFLTYAAAVVCFTMAFTAVYTLICAMVTNKAYSVVVTLGVCILMQMTASGIYDRLCEPEITAPAMAYIDGEMVSIAAGPNPLYIGGPLRAVLEFLVGFLPAGQTLMVSFIDLQHPLREILLSLAFTSVMLGIGIQLFRRKDIR